MRSRGELPKEEMPGATFPPNPLWEQLCQALEFGAFATVQSVKAPRHINIGELRAALRAEAKVGRMHPGCRYLQLLDSQVALGALVKGRASSTALNFELTRSLPDHLGSRSRPFFGYATSGSNRSDDPTRHRAIRSPSMPLPAWLREALEGRFELFDAFLTEEGLHPKQLRNLPNPRELAADAPVDPQPDLTELPNLPKLVRPDDHHEGFASLCPGSCAIRRPALSFALLQHCVDLWEQ